ncbi:GtrA family protein [Virgisporangium aliadipatigenens]|uniref:GtrA family protein n=1 Tax=Virgisporangium aliadipatigenens TaxID=741659 RepID=UPI001EF186A9|nr:GtrA family protein [Virgisporangium aliadipatigenens]
MSTQQRPGEQTVSPVDPDEPHTVDIASATAEVSAADHAPDVETPRGLGRFRHLVHELGKFGTVGGISFIVDTAIFLTLQKADFEPLTAATISMVIAASVAFVGNRFWTWRDRERTGLRREYSLYFIFNLIGLLITLACLGITTYGLGAIWPVFSSDGAEFVAKQIVGTGLGTLFRFWAYRNIVFKK